MILPDRYGLPVTVASAAARDAYVAAVDCFLAADPAVDAAVEAVLAADPDCALAHVAAARLHQVNGRGAAARAAMQRALDVPPARLAPRERSHIAALAPVVAGDGAAAMAAIRAHLAEHPRDATVLLPCVGVFGLFGFSGRADREHALAEFLAPFAAHYGDDWWFLAALAFAQVETGALDAARSTIERALAGNPRNANGAHIRNHVDYESGEDAAGLAWLTAWLRGYDRSGLMHCHLAWHAALWQLDLGRTADAWQTYDAQVRPGGAWGPPLNVVTDAASFLLRAELAGEPRDEARWRAVAEYARAAYPVPGLAFADVHVALACAMAGDSDALAALIAGARGPAGDLVATLARGFGAYADGDWATAAGLLASACPTHARIGGSRAQRDLIEYAAMAAARRAGRPCARQRARPLPAPMARALA